MTDGSDSTSFESGGKARPRRVLVVDDDARNRRLLDALLAPEGYDVVHASSGEEALTRIAAEPLDVVLLDLAMPGLGGVETCRRVRQQLGKRDLPIVFITAHGARSDRIEAKRAGADDFLLKPIDEVELLARVATLTEVKAYRDERERQRTQLETELERRTQQLLRADRLVTLGTLAGAVGHELNNVAQVMSSALELLHGSASRNEPADPEDLTSLDAAFEHLRTHARQLLSLARPGPDKEEPLDLRTIVTGALQLLRVAGRTRGVTVDASLPAEPVLVQVNRVRVEQVLLNLVGNAVDAVQDDTDESHRRVHVEIRPGDDFAPGAGKMRVFCTVRDQGRGIPADVLPNIFTAYFTTKGPERGTGLGLAIVRQIVEGYGGQVSVTSDEDRGTTFAFDLPSAR